MKVIIKYVIPLVAATSLLVGCSQPKTRWVYSHSQGQVVQRDAHINLLRKEGARVFIQGETARIVLPSQAVFMNQTAAMSFSGQSLVGHVAQLIKTFDVVRVSVSAYADSSAWKAAVHNPNKQLTTQQAQAVSKQLWSSGINMRMITAKGMGDQRAVAWNGTPRGRNDNRRIEITFRFYPHKEIYY
jgi:intracellular multiplication protein IcmN